MVHLDHLLRVASPESNLLVAAVAVYAKPKVIDSTTTVACFLSEQNQKPKELQAIRYVVFWRRHPIENSHKITGPQSIANT
jgi:hypothetical protein